MDLGVPKTVRGVITQGARGGDAGSGASTDNRAFVRKYKVAYSLNGKEWNFIMDMKTSLPKVGVRRGLMGGNYMFVCLYYIQHQFSNLPHATEMTLHFYICVFCTDI